MIIHSIQPILAADPLWLIGGGVVAVAALVFVILVMNFFSVWIRALFSGAKVRFTELIALRLRSVPVGLVVDTRITAVKSSGERASPISASSAAGSNVGNSSFGLAIVPPSG